MSSKKKSLPLGKIKLGKLNVGKIKVGSLGPLYTNQKNEEERCCVCRCEDGCE